MTECRIAWTNSLDDWDSDYQKLPFTTLPQSLPYARVMREIHQQKTRFGVIDINGSKAGLVACQEVGLLGNRIHAVIIDRGPLWYEGFGKPDHLAAFFKEFNRQFPKRFLRKRRILSETQDTPANRTVLSTYLKRREKNPGYQTIIVDLKPDLEEIRGNLRGNWRNQLKKAEKGPLAITIDKDGRFLDTTLAQYTKDRLAKNYAGASVKLLKRYAHYAIPRHEFSLITACEGSEIIAAALIFSHGKTATYQVGWSLDRGRELNAMNLVLWEAIKMLKQDKIDYFDLGGISSKNEAKGLTTFKEGLGGQKICLIGHYE